MQHAFVVVVAAAAAAAAAAAEKYQHITWGEMFVVAIEDDPSVVRSSVSKAFTLLGVLAEWEGGDATLSEIAAAAGLPKSSAHRLLHEIELHGLVDRLGSRYRIGSRMFELSQAAIWSQHGHLRDNAAPVLEQLFERTRLTVHFAVLVASDVLYLEKITAPSGSGIPSRVGSRMPATCTALGKAMLAFSPPEVLERALRSRLSRRTPHSVREPVTLVDQLKAIRLGGVATECDESKLGLSCLAAPVLVDGLAVAAVSVSAYRSRVDLRTHVPTVQQAAKGIADRTRA